MFCRNSFEGFGEDDLSADELRKLIEIGDQLEKIASGEISATPEQRANAKKLVEKFGNV